MTRPTVALVALVGLSALQAGAAQAHSTMLMAEVTGGPGWRVAFGQDLRRPGFLAITGGLDALVGLEFGGVAGIILGGRLRTGAASDDSYLEVSGDLGAQLRIGERVRARLGAAIGHGWIQDLAHDSILLGGWAAVGFDLVQFSAGRAALALALRLDAGSFIGDDRRFPVGTLALCGGLGGRY